MSSTSLKIFDQKQYRSQNLPYVSSSGTNSELASGISSRLGKWAAGMGSWDTGMESWVAGMSLWSSWVAGMSVWTSWAAGMGSWATGISPWAGWAAGISPWAPWAAGISPCARWAALLCLHVMVLTYLVKNSKYSNFDWNKSINLFTLGHLLLLCPICL
nr:protein FAM63B-like [Ipomoea batatas]